MTRNLWLKLDTEKKRTKNTSVYMFTLGNGVHSMLQHVKTMYNQCGLVHGDLSEYNMLWQDDTLYFIDVSQSVEKFHPRAGEFLLRDLTNVVNVSLVVIKGNSIFKCATRGLLVIFMLTLPMPLELTCLPLHFNFSYPGSLRILETVNIP